MFGGRGGAQRCEGKDDVILDSWGVWRVVAGRGGPEVCVLGGWDHLVSLLLQLFYSSVFIFICACIWAIISCMRLSYRKKKKRHGYNNGSITNISVSLFVFLNNMFIKWKWISSFSAQGNVLQSKNQRYSAHKIIEQSKAENLKILGLKTEIICQLLLLWQWRLTNNQSRLFFSHFSTNLVRLTLFEFSLCN